jgi:hypothetical protein
MAQAPLVDYQSCRVLTVENESKQVAVTHAQSMSHIATALPLHTLVSEECVNSTVSTYYKVM